MDIICALVLFTSVHLAAGMAPLMGSFVPVGLGRPQSEEEVRMLVQSAQKKFPMATENMYEGRKEGRKLPRPMPRMPKMMKYRYGTEHICSDF